MLKENLRAAIRRINDMLLTTLAACGDVERNVMCCPAPYDNNPVRREMQAMADRLAEHLNPRTTAYHEIWLTDENGAARLDASRIRTGRSRADLRARPICRANSKRPSALPDDNCVDLYANDLGLLAIVEKVRSSATTCWSAAAWA